MYTLLPQHGIVSCTRCFQNAQTKESRVEGKFLWQLLHGPGAWGSQDPIILLLGFSKGDTQLNAVGNCQFEDVPFKGMRPNIEQVLRRLALLPNHISLSQLRKH